MKKLSKLLVLSILSLTAFSIKPVIVKAEGSIQDEINSIVNETTYVLSQDETEVEISEDKNITIDLNGFHLTKVINRGTLTLIDSKKTGGINLSSDVAETALAVANYGVLTIDGISITVTTNARNSYPVSIHNYAAGSLNIKSGNITSVANGVAYAFGIANEGMLSISGGSISSYVKNVSSGANNSIGIHNYSNGIIKSISGGTIYAESNSNDGYATAIRNQGTSKIESISNGTISAYVDNQNGQAKAYGIYNLSGTVSSISGGTIKGKSEAAQWAFGLWNTSSVNNISGGSFIAEINHEKNSPNAIAIANDKTINSISGGVLYAKSTCPNGGTFAIRTRNSGSIISSISGGAYYVNKIQDNRYIYSENNGVNNIEAGYSLSNNSELTNYRYLLPNDSKIEEKYIDEDNLMTCNVYDSSNSLITSYRLIGTELNKAMIGEETYVTVEEALENAKDNDIVTIMDNCDESLTINKNITIDLNGYTISKTITNNGSLILKDNKSMGRIYLNTGENGLFAGVKNYGNLIIDGIAIRVNGLSDNTECHGIYNYAGATLTFKSGLIRCVSKGIKFGHGIVNAGTIKSIEGGIIESYSLSKNTASNIVGISNLGTIEKIDAGIIYAQTYGKNGFAIGIRNQSNAVIKKINGGTIKGYACSSEGGTESKGFGIYNQSGSIEEISGGHIEGRSTAAQWAFGIWNPANMTISSIIGGEIYAIGEHNFSSSSPNFIALSNDGKVDSISGGLFYATSMHDKGGTFAIRNRGTITNINGGTYYVSKDNNELIRNENGTLNIQDGFEMLSLNSRYHYLVSSEQVVCEILDENNAYLSSRIYQDGKLISSLGNIDRVGYYIQGFSLSAYDNEISLGINELSGLNTSTSVYVHYESAPTFYFLGSSVTYGFATGGVSFVNEIQNTLNCNCVKEAVSGTTLTDNGPSSYVKRMENNIPKDAKIENLVVQLSTNDVTQNKPFGSISNSQDISSFNKETVLGAIEYIIAYAKATWDCEVTFYTNPDFNNSNYELLITKLYDVQDKWDIGIIDFYNYVNMEALSQETLNSYMSDSIHPNAKGYAWMGSIMAEYLKSNFEAKHPGISI